MRRADGLDFSANTTLLVTTAAGLEGEARRELCRVLPGAHGRPLLMKGNIVVATELPEREVLARIAAADTRCVARVLPVQAQAPVGADPACFSGIAAAAARVGRIRRGDTFVVRCHRRGDHPWASRDLARAAALELEPMLAAVGDYNADVDWHVAVEVYQDTAYIGVNRPPDILRKVLRKQRKYAPGERPLNRAQWKIREALAAFDICLPERARVIDLGSAPGGWAMVLADIADEVVAVDPASLDARVCSLPNVRHLQCRAEDLAQRADLRGRFDLLTSDMNVAPAHAAGLLCDLAGLLKEEAPAIMTVKYMTPRRRRHEREARAILSARYEDIRMRRLPHNARETTAAMRRRASKGAGPD